MLLAVSPNIPYGYALDWQDHYEGYAFDILPDLQGGYQNGTYEE